jgi:hypothetical protein
VPLLIEEISAQLPLDESVPQFLVDIFEGYRELLALYQVATTIEDSSRQVDMLHWAHLRRFALSVRTLEAKAAVEKHTESPNLSIDRAFCIAIEYFSQILWHKNHPQRAVITPFRYWNDAFQVLQEATVTELETSCKLLWITFIGATVELMLTRKTRRTGFFTRAFGTLASQLGVQSCVEARYALSAFLYDEEIFDPYLEVLMGPSLDVDERLCVNVIQVGTFAPKPQKTLATSVLLKRSIIIPIERRQDSELVIPLQQQ